MGTVLAMGTQLGFMIALPLVICIITGIYIDKRFNTFPWFLLISVFAGIGLTLIDIYKVIIPFLEKRSDNKIIK
ncbi:MAG: AtpZ/AtpI family protein [Candidatus Pacebacteria bacterium]|nr:AtpZ/AtpI family protein [Candidatus Paceibacterota bacterium]